MPRACRYGCDLAGDMVVYSCCMGLRNSCSGCGATCDSVHWRSIVLKLCQLGVLHRVCSICLKVTLGHPIQQQCCSAAAYYSAANSSQLLSCSSADELQRCSLVAVMLRAKHALSVCKQMKPFTGVTLWTVGWSCSRARISSRLPWWRGAHFSM